MQKIDWNDPLTKKIRFIVIVMTLLLVALFIFHSVMGYFIQSYFTKLTSLPNSVSAIKVQYESWQPTIRAVASIRSPRGVDVTTELAGMVRHIKFNPGQFIDSGKVLVELNIDPDVAQLHVNEANRDIALITYNRDKLQYAAQGISKEKLDTDLANLKSAQAQVDQQQANIDKKIIRAPFAGKLGLSMVNLGQYLNPGDKIVTLQAMDPLWVDFFVPEFQITQIQMGKLVTLTTDAFPGKIFEGKITSMDSKIDVNTRNIQVEATFSNPEGELFPGMFAEVHVKTGEPQKLLTVPQTSISYNPYGDLVYVIKKSKDKDENGKAKLVVSQTFVTVGETRGDQVAVLSGIKEGDVIVTAGSQKLKNGSIVTINNAVTPSNNPNPVITDNRE